MHAWTVADLGGGEGEGGEKRFPWGPDKGAFCFCLGTCTCIDYAG